MPRHPFLLRLLCLCLLPFAGTVLAGKAYAAELWKQPAFSIPAQELLAGAQEVESPDDAAAHMLLYETEYTLDATGVTRLRERQVYRVLTPAGAEVWSTVDTDWSPWYQERPRIRARVVTAEGRVHELDPATVGEAPGAVEDPNLFHDRRSLRAPLPAVAVGSVVELEITVEQTEPYFPAGETHRHWLAMGIPVRRSRVILDAPADLSLSFHTALLPSPEPAVTEAGDRLRRTFEHRDVPALEEIPPGLPPEIPLAPYVAFTTGTSWTDLGRAYSALVDERIAGSELDGFAPGDGTAESQWERIAELLAASHRQVRYTGVQFGDAGIVPRTPAETLSRRFGDCKDKAVLLTALLRREGIPAYVALLSAGFGPDAEPELPGLGLFNHAIVYVPGASPLWIDATDPYAPLGSLPLADTGRWALVASPNTRGLVRTPDAESHHHRVREERKIYLAEHGEARVVEISEMVGSPAREIRSSWEGATRQEISDMLTAYVESTYGASELSEFEHSPLSDPEPPLTLRLEAEDATYTITDLTEAVAILPVGGLFQRLPASFNQDPAEDAEDADPREHDFFLFEPHRVTWRYELHVPENLTLREMPENAEHVWGPLRYTRRFETADDGRRITAVFELDTGSRRYSPEDLATVRRGLADLEEIEDGHVMIWLDQTVQAELNAGRVGEALGEARRLIDLHPDEALHRGQLAQALLTGGLGAEAREETRRAVELEPESAVAWLLRGWVLSHDEVGRYLVEGFDRQGARQAYERMRELDPDLSQDIANLAVLLEHDAQGRRYSDEADLDQAIEVYESVREDLADTELEQNLTFALFWAERFDEMEDELDRLGSPRELLYLELTSRAIRQGADAALAEASRRQSDVQERVGTLAQTALHLMLTRHYEEAAAFYRAIGRLSPEAAQVLSLADLLARTRRTEPSDAALKDAVPNSPEALIHTYLGWFLREEDAESDAALDLFSEPLRRARSGTDAQPLGSIAALVRRNLDTLGVPPEVVRDFTFAALKLRTEGDPDVGYRVTLRTSAVAGNVDTKLFVVREGEQYRLAGSKDDPPLLALEARRRLEAEDYEGAAQWLSWAVEEQFQGSGTDPLLTDAGPRFWSAGSPPDPHALRIATAAVLSDGNEVTDEWTAEVLEAEYEAADDAGREKLQQALYQAYLALEDERALDLAEELLDRHPDSDMALYMVWDAARQADRLEVVRRRIAQRLETNPEDATARELRADLAQLDEDFPAAREIFADLIEDGEADGETYNQAAWLDVILDQVDETTITRARQGAEQTHYRAYPVLHTLATALAENGRAAEAYQVLAQALTITGRTPGASDWYVLGRLAELYGLPHAARSYYRRTLEGVEGEISAMSSAALAQRRLTRLDDDTGAADSTGR